MIVKALIQQFDLAAQNWLPLKVPINENIVAWTKLHGWDVSDAECQHLLIRQALLNAVIRQTVPGVEHGAFAVPLDSMRVEAPQPLLDAVSAAVQHSRVNFFNFWGELYSTLIPQSQRRRIGQFWTDEHIAEWMVAWLLQFRPKYLADVGCGVGNFLLKAAQLLRKDSNATELWGCDISPLLLNVAQAAFRTQSWDNPPILPTLTVNDFLTTPLSSETDAVICNPPYTRHHHIPPGSKDALQAFFKKQFRVDVSRLGTLAFYFLLKLIAEMPDGAHAAVIVPMEVLDARYGQTARRILAQYTTISAIVHFSPQMNAFHKVDVGASIVLFRKGYEKQNQVCHLTLNTLPTAEEFLNGIENRTQRQRELPFGSVMVQPQDELIEISKWFSISTPKPSNEEWERSGLVVPLKELAKVVRGIATGANDFFVLPTSLVKQCSLEPYVVRTLQRNREVQDIVLDESKWQALSIEGKRVWLLYLNGDDVSKQSLLRSYLDEGEAQGYHLRSLVKTRKKWYAMEQREIPAIFFTILTRGNPRFILNQAGVRPLNMFLLIYPNQHVIRANATELLWALLNSSFSLSRLHSVSRTYGGNTLKVEPRELDNVPVINPLALPEDIRQKIGGWIEDFHSHRQATILTSQIDELTEQLLHHPLPSNEMRSSLPIQPRLLEDGEEYKS